MFFKPPAIISHLYRIAHVLRLKSVIPDHHNELILFEFLINTANHTINILKSYVHCLHVETRYSCMDSNEKDIAPHF